jgi:hypothetical protein
MDYFEVITDATTGEQTIRPYTAEEVAAAIAALPDSIRAVRDTILTNVVDPLVSNPLRWADLTAETQAAWTAYRRALLDVTQQEGFPTAVIWPTQPSA